MLRRVYNFFSTIIFVACYDESRCFPAIISNSTKTSYYSSVAHPFPPSPLSCCVQLFVWVVSSCSAAVGHQIPSLPSSRPPVPLQRDFGSSPTGWHVPLAAAVSKGLLRYEPRWRFFIYCIIWNAFPWVHFQAKGTFFIIPDRKQSYARSYRTFAARGSLEFVSFPRHFTTQEVVRKKEHMTLVFYRFESRTPHKSLTHDKLRSATTAAAAVMADCSN